MTADSLQKQGRELIGTLFQKGRSGIPGGRRLAIPIAAP